MSAGISDPVLPSTAALPSPSTAPAPSSHSSPPSTSTSLLAGAIAGILVDVVLFPLDTIKTRMQSHSGFYASGGFRDIYAGVASAAIGSAPSAACFFVTYEWVKHSLLQRGGERRYEAAVHCTAAACAEAIACLVRVPTDNIKQKRQAGLYSTTGATFSAIVASPAGWRGFYTGYVSTIMREIPFSLIQFPLYERMKVVYAESTSQPPSPLVCAVMGSVSGSVAAAVTTPMDVVKTRMMLGGEGGIWTTMKAVYEEGGVRRLFSGIGPRVLWIGLGGAVFLGGYEAAKSLIDKEKRARADRAHPHIQ